jgi:hypothetical protein
MYMCADMCPDMCDIPPLVLMEGAGALCAPVCAPSARNAVAAHARVAIASPAATADRALEANLKMSEVADIVGTSLRIT